MVSPIAAMLKCVIFAVFLSLTNALPFDILHDVVEGLQKRSLNVVQLNDFSFDLTTQDGHSYGQVSGNAGIIYDLLALKYKYESRSGENLVRFKFKSLGLQYRTNVTFFGQVVQGLADVEVDEPEVEIKADTIYEGDGKCNVTLTTHMVTPFEEVKLSFKSFSYENRLNISIKLDNISKEVAYILSQLVIFPDLRKAIDEELCKEYKYLQRN